MDGGAAAVLELDQDDCVIEAGLTGIDGDGLGAEQVEQQIKDVHHFNLQTATEFPALLGRTNSVVVADSIGHGGRAVQIAEGSGQERDGGSEPSIEADCERNVILRGATMNGEALRRGRSKRLFHVNGLTRFQGCSCDQRVEFGHNPDHHNIDCGIGHDVFPIHADLLGAVLSPDSLCFEGIARDEVLKPQMFAAMDGLDVLATHELAAANHADSNRMGI